MGGVSLLSVDEAWAKIAAQAGVLGVGHPAYKLIMNLADEVRSGDPSNVEASDGNCELYLDRARLLQSNPPPADWDGVFELTGK